MLVGNRYTHKQRNVKPMRCNQFHVYAACGHVFAMCDESSAQYFHMLLLGSSLHAISMAMWVAKSWWIEATLSTKDDFPENIRWAYHEHHKATYLCTYTRVSMCLQEQGSPHQVRFISMYSIWEAFCVFLLLRPDQAHGAKLQQALACRAVPW